MSPEKQWENVLTCCLLRKLQYAQILTEFKQGCGGGVKEVERVKNSRNKDNDDDNDDADEGFFRIIDD